MAITARVVHCFQAQGGTSKDQYCNQFYFWHATHTAADADTWGGLLAAYVHNYFVSQTGGTSVSRWYSNRCLGNLGRTKIYDASVAGGPVYEIADEVLVPSAEYLVDASGALDLPEEVALCLSYQAIHTGGDLPRRRGRIYLGPLNVDAIANPEGDSSPVRPAQGLMDCMNGAAQQVQQAAASNDWHWRVYSRMDGFAFDIVQFSVDNAFDTVRGRGRAPTERFTVPIL